MALRYSRAATEVSFREKKMVHIYTSLENWHALDKLLLYGGLDI
jgi:hypothetical protein